MKSQVTSWLMVGAALGLLLIAGRLDIILIAGPMSLLVGLATTHAGGLRQRKILSEK